jgi:hypothetical protein
MLLVDYRVPVLLAVAVYCAHVLLIGSSFDCDLCCYSSLCSCDVWLWFLEFCQHSVCPCVLTSLNFITVQEIRVLFSDWSLHPTGVWHACTFCDS